MTSIDRQEIEEIRDMIRRFRQTEESRLSFRVETDLERRIDVIYSIIFPGFKKYQFYLNFTLARIAEKLDYSPLKVLIYRLIGMKVGRGVFISADVILDPHFPELVQIGDYAILGWGAKLFTHEYYDNTYRMGRVTIGRGAQVGAYSVVRSGVTIGEMAETSPFSVIYKNVGNKERYFDGQAIKGYVKSNMREK